MESPHNNIKKENLPSPESDLEGKAFVYNVETFAQSIVDFHKRFDVASIPQLIGERFEMLHEEYKEYKHEVEAAFYGADNEDYYKELLEVADIAYVALGTLQLAGRLGRKAVFETAMKNNAKTWDTHYRDSETGKITKKTNQEDKNPLSQLRGQDTREK